MLVDCNVTHSLKFTIFVLYCKLCLNYQICAESLICQINKSLTLSPAELLIPLEIPDTIWSDVSMDVTDGLPKAARHEVIFVVVDRLSKYTHFLAIKHPYTAKTVVAVFVKEVVKLHGYPRSIVSDRDRVFISNFWNELFQLASTKLQRSSAYHPQTDGQTEVVNRGGSISSLFLWRKTERVDQLAALGRVLA